MNARDYERARSALTFIPSDDRELWVSIGMAIKDGFGDEGFDLWDAWSRKSDRYDERDARDVWRSIKAGGGITLGTLFHEAKARSWRDDGTYQKPTPEEIEARRREAAERTAKEEVEERARHEAAAARAAEILAAARAAEILAAATGDPAAGDPAAHPYAIKKRVPFGPLVRRGLWPQRGWKDALLVPIYDSVRLWSIEAINADGSKDFLKGALKRGGFHPFGKIRGASRVLIAEGLANAAIGCAVGGSPAAAAMGKSNLLHAALAVRKLAPEAEFIFLADNGLNVPREAQDAARAVGGRVAVCDLGGRECDFWDLWHERGVEAVQRAIADAKAPAAKPGNGAAPAGACGAKERPKPQPLTVKVTPEPYPIDALPDAMRAAVMEVQAFTKAPMVLAGASAMGALSMACQAHVDIERAKKLRGPTGLYLLTIADSGERKTTCDAFFDAPIREYDADQADRLASELKDNRAAIAGWKAEHEGVLLAIREKSKKGKVPPALMESLKKLEHYKPEPLRVPKISRLDDTPEKLAWVLSKEWPSAGVASSDAGIVFGGHAMGKDSIMRNLSQLNILWDGGTLSIGRRTSESFTVRGARLTLALQVQEATLRNFFDRSEGLARGSGFLARFLVAWPESTQGYRPFTEAPADWPALSSFNRRIREILEFPVPISKEGCLTPKLMMLTPEAKAAWVVFHDDIEGELRNGGELYDVRDVASKIGDNAVRLAAQFQVFEHGTPQRMEIAVPFDVGLDAFQRASRVAAWHLNEARRFFGELALPPELVDAARLDAWLIEHCRRERMHKVPTKKVQQFGPAGLRERAKIEAAVRELEELGRVRLVPDGRRKEIHVNPALLA